jgi:large subunit ribosomal protein L10
MKTRETKQKDLAALTESLQNSKSAMVVSFTKLSVTKDQEFRNSLREAGAEYRVVKNTLARIAVKGTQFEPATEHFKGVTAIAWTQNDPVILTKAISKFMKENADTYTFKTGVLDGRLLDLKQVSEIASLPSKEELISKLLYVLNAQAQRIVTVINAVPRDLAVVIKQIGDAKPAGAAPEPPAEVKAEEPAAAIETEAAAPAETQISEPAVEAAPADAATPADAPAPVTEVEPNAQEAETVPEEAALAEQAEADKTEEASSAETTAPIEPAGTSESEAESAAAEPDEKAEELLNSAATADTEAGAEAIAAAPEDKAEEVIASSPAADSEAGSEAAVAAPDDKAEELLNTPEADAEDRV